MTITAISAELLISALTGKTREQCRIIDASYNPQTRTVEFEIAGSDVPAQDRVTIQLKTVYGLMGSRATVFDCFGPDDVQPSASMSDR